MTAASLFGDPPDAAHCPDCGAVLNAGQTRCWLCHRSLAIDAELVRDSVQPRHANPLQFSLDTLFLVITLIAVCLGATLAAPGLGVLLIIVVVPAVIRTVMAGARERAADHRWTTSEKIVGFLASAGITALVIAAGYSAFLIVGITALLAACGLGGEGQPFESALAWLFLGIALASPFLGLGITSWLFWRTWPR